MKTNYMKHAERLRKYYVEKNRLIINKCGLQLNRVSEKMLFNSDHS